MKKRNSQRYANWVLAILVAICVVFAPGGCARGEAATPPVQAADLPLKQGLTAKQSSKEEPTIIPGFQITSAPLDIPEAVKKIEWKERQVKKLYELAVAKNEEAGRLLEEAEAALNSARSADAEYGQLLKDLSPEDKKLYKERKGN